MKRLLSLDVFRGLTMAMMIVVNHQSGPAFAALRHKPWDGCTPTDLVFPFFLFIVGASMWFSYRKTGHELTGQTFGRLAKRGALIFVVGFLLNWFPFWDFGAGEWRSLATMRIMNVLQRIGVAFFAGGVLALWLGSYKRILTAVAIILGGYWLTVELFGDATLEGFVGNRVDAFLLGAQHLYKPALSFDPEGLFSTIPAVATVLLGYVAGKFVGEGLAGGSVSSTAIGGGGVSAATGGCGVSPILGGLGIGGGLAVMAALALNTVSPINKGIWSPTFVLYTAGLAMLVWMILLWFYDLRGKVRSAVDGEGCGSVGGEVCGSVNDGGEVCSSVSGGGAADSSSTGNKTTEKKFGATFFSVFGTNTLFAYVLTGVLMRVLSLPWFRFTVGERSHTVWSWWHGVVSEGFTWAFGAGCGPQLGTLAASITLVLVIWAMIWPLYKRRIFIRL